MNIKFKSFHDSTITKCRSSMFGDSYYTTTDLATNQVEKFIKENNITTYSIRDIKFSVDSKCNEHILLIYDEDQHENERNI